MDREHREVVAVVPARAGSERVKSKNTRAFAGIDGGLLELKLMQLAQVKALDKVIVSTNDPIAFDFTSKFARTRDRRVLALERPDELGASSTPMSSFIQYVAGLEDDGVMMMTHVTHPFVTSEVLAHLIEAWWEAEAAGYDSLMTVTKVHKFLWDKKGAYNYDNTVEKWPRSQDIEPLFEINHAAYLMPFPRMREVGDRVGHVPCLYELPERVAMDIDWEDQFRLLEDIALAKRGRGESLL